MHSLTARILWMGAPQRSVCPRSPPPASGGDPDYAFVANRLLAGLRHTRQRWEVVGALQYVQFGGLPDAAIGPGPLGTGGLYFDASRDTSSRQVFLKTLTRRLTHPRGVSLVVGRMPYTSGSEIPSGVPAIEAVKRQRLHA